MSANSKIAEVRVGKLAANIVGTFLTIVFCVAGVLLARVLPHYQPFVRWHSVPLLLCLIVLFPIHEGLHAAGLSVFARVRWSDIRFGVMWRALMPYCHCTVPISVSAYRRMALLPLWITGGASFAALLIVPTDGLGMLAGVTAAACVGDVWMVAKLRRFPNDSLVQDCPSEIGCDVSSSITETAA